MALFLLTACPAMGQRAGTSAGGGLGSQLTIRGVGFTTPLNTFGRVGGNYTMTASPGLDPNRGGGLPTGPMGPASATLPYQFPGASAEPGRRFDDRLSRNSKMAAQMFGPDRAFGLLGRTSTSGVGDTFSIGGAPMRPRVRGAGMGGTTFRPGLTPAVLFLDRNMTVRTNSNLARLAMGPRRPPEERSPRPDDAGVEWPKGSDFESPAPPVDGDATAARSDDSVASSDGSVAPWLRGSVASPYEQRRQERASREYAKCIERGDAYARSGELYRARSCYERAGLYDGDRSEPYLKLAVVSLLTSDPAQSGVFLRQGLRRMKSEEDIRIRAADFVIDESALRRLLASLGPGSPTGTATASERVLSGFLLWMLNDAAAARSEVQRALELAPDWEEAARFARYLETAREPSGGR